MFYVCLLLLLSRFSRQRRQPTRLPRPWDSPGKNTGVGCHFLLRLRIFRKLILFSLYGWLGFNLVFFFFFFKTSSRLYAHRSVRCPFLLRYLRGCLSQYLSLCLFVCLFLQSYGL